MLSCVGELGSLYNGEIHNTCHDEGHIIIKLSCDDSLTKKCSFLHEECDGSHVFP